MLSIETHKLWGRTFSNLGKDIRTVASGVVGIGDSAEVYAVEGENGEK